MTQHPSLTTATSPPACSTPPGHPKPQHQPARPKSHEATQTIHIRTTASPTHAGPIAHLGAQVFTATFGHSVTPAELSAYLDSAYTIPHIAADLAHPDKTTIIATSTGKNGEQHQHLLGFALLTRNSNRAEPSVAHLDPGECIELQRLYVAGGAQGRGVGSLLVGEAERMARAEGRKHVWLGVWEENWGAQRAYARWGFERVGEHGFSVGGVVQVDWVMVKGLA
ncbi:acyl-n-acyltransferase protein [Diplodia corticola]|uniref:Acyl-n-acyltransferase protein n=1 Tax=Diplodia corticola TaxID=236234 RepID=A0A1J9RNE1_9PEZI|nr:acyl-n-acyltransferase protein [Diplodia corticola]OJD34059.1 acyl-n-acyltransferase protein [Diplodia corticola]